MNKKGFVALPILVILALGAVSTTVYILSKSNLPSILSRPTPTTSPQIQPSTSIQPSAGTTPMPSPSIINRIDPTPTPTLPYKIDDKDTITWEEAQDLIKNCKVKAAMQSHQLNVFLTLEDGRRLNTVEPKIDQIFTELRLVDDKCGSVIKSSE